MHKLIECEIKGIAPLIMHNVRLANPLDEIVKAMKLITSKKKKTDEDYGELSRLEFAGGLYLDGNGAPCVPGECIEGMMWVAAKRQKLGKQCRAGLISDGLWPLKYSGPKAVEGLWAAKSFVDVRAVRVGAARVMRTRPIFHEWSLSFTLAYLPDELNAAQVVEFLGDAASKVGLLDNRPKYGRFNVVSAAAAKEIA